MATWWFLDWFETQGCVSGYVLLATTHAQMVCADVGVVHTFECHYHDTCHKAVSYDICAFKHQACHCPSLLKVKDVLQPF